MTPELTAKMDVRGSRLRRLHHHGSTTDQRHRLFQCIELAGEITRFELLEFRRVFLGRVSEEVILQPVALFLRALCERGLDDVDAFKLAFAQALSPDESEHFQSALPGKVGLGIGLHFQQSLFPVRLQSVER